MTPDWLLGRAGYAFFDYWFLSHLSFWVVTGSALASLKVNRTVAGLLCLTAAFLWEMFERYAEQAWPSIWQSPESLWNAWLSDPLTVFMGLGVAFIGFDRWRGTPP